MCAATVSASRPALLDAGQCRQHLRRHLLVELDVLLELRDDRAHQHVHLALVVGLAIRLQRHIGGVVVAGLELLDARAVDALDQHLDGAVRQLQQLQDGGDGADAVQVLDLRIIDIGLLLRDQHDALVAVHGDIERLDRFLPAHEQRDAPCAGRRPRRAAAAPGRSGAVGALGSSWSTGSVMASSSLDAKVKACARTERVPRRLSRD